MKNIKITEDVIDKALNELYPIQRQDLIVESGYYDYIRRYSHVTFYDWLKQNNKFHEFYFEILKRIKYDNK